MRKPVCITIGNFDGVHLGHRSLLELAGKIASENDLDFEIVTFWPHPRDVLRGKGSHRPLSSGSERLNLLKSAGASEIHEIPFTKDLAVLSADQFVSDYLMPLGMRELVIGHDFTLGCNRTGDATLLARIGGRHGFHVTQAEVFKINGLPVSSTLLRNFISGGRVREAAQMLGRNYALSGKIVHGEARGAGLGFPTANLDAIDELVPANGVYATFADVDGKRYRAVTNIGTNPTFNGKARTIESFLLDGGGDLYDRPLRLEFVERLRGEKKFDSPASLIRQIEADIATAKALPEFNEYPRS